jgi:polysaccharide export outer membrane protein
MKLKASLLTLAVLVASLAVGYAQSPAPAPAQNPAVDTQGIRNYLLGPGDLVDVRVFGQTEFNSVVEVDSEGNLSSLPYLDSIPAKCRTEQQVQRDIAAAYAKYLNNAQVSVRIIERKSRPPATIYGAVHQPNQVPMLRNIRLNELVSKGGGYTDRASGTIQILHTEPVMCPAPGAAAEAPPPDGIFLPRVIRIADLKTNKPGANPMIRPGDFVSVTEAEQVYITGTVVNPTGIFMRDNLTLGWALAMVGGLSKEAKASDVIIRRLKSGSDQREIIHVDYAAIRNNKKPDVLLRAFDLIEVRESSPLSAERYKKTIFDSLLKALGGLPGRLPLLP